MFAPGEADYPAGLAPFTPQSYRAHLHAARPLETTTDPDRKAELEKGLLSKEQQTALARIKRYTDLMIWRHRAASAGQGWNAR